jgi:ABC-type Fe3+-siderophore transport system permease subunit
MTVAPALGHVPGSTGSGEPHSRIARWAVGLSALFGVAIAAAIMTFAFAFAVGGETATEDNWVGYLVAGMAFTGLFGSLAAFLLAIIAKIRRERWVLLWLPLSLFPMLLLFLVLGEALWWE